MTQSFALLPGISRSGVTMVASLRARLSHEEALRFTFLLATPVIALAGLLEIPKLIGTAAHPVTHNTQIAAAAGGVAAFVAAHRQRHIPLALLPHRTSDAVRHLLLLAGLSASVIFAGISLHWFSLPWAGK